MNKTFKMSADGMTRRQREQLMGFGTSRPGAVRNLLFDLRGAGVLGESETFLDIGAGSGNVLDDAEEVYPGLVWGVEINSEWKQRTPSKWQDSIFWCAVQDLPMDCARQRATTVAYMYDLCLKTLSRKARTCAEDPHWAIQRALLDPSRFPALRVFISTYPPDRMYGIDGSSWALRLEVNLPCSTGSYRFYVYERTLAADSEKEDKAVSACCVSMPRTTAAPAASASSGRPKRARDGSARDRPP
jgi:hypothetical protein